MRWYLALALAALAGVVVPHDGLVGPADLPPPRLAIVWGPIIAAVAPALVSAIGGLIGQRTANNANRRAADQADASNREALDFQREQEARRQDEWDRTQKTNEDMWRSEVAREQRNADRLFAEDQFRDRRLEPYRVAGRAALADLDARRAGSMRDLMPIGRV